MGLQSQLNDVSSESLPILFLALLATTFAYFRSLLIPFSSFLGFSAVRSSALADTVLSEQSYLKVLADRHDDEDEEDVDGQEKEKCIVCLSGFKEGARVSKLTCGHVFHRVCLDGWIGQLKFSCPLCRSPLVSDCRVDRAHRRFARLLVSWFAVR